MTRRRGEVAAEIGGKPVVLRLTLEKMAALEEFTGRGILDIAEGIAALRSTAIIEALCLAAEGGSAKPGSAYSRAEMGRHVQDMGFHAAALLVAAAVHAAISGIPDVEDEPEKKADAARG